MVKDYRYFSLGENARLTAGNSTVVACSSLFPQTSGGVELGYFCLKKKSDLVCSPA